MLWEYQIAVQVCALRPKSSLVEGSNPFTPTKYFALVVKLAKTAVSKAVSESVVGSSPTWGTIVSWVAESMGLINHKISAIMPDDFVLSR